MSGDDLRLFDVVVDQSLGDDTLEALMTKWAIALERGDHERARLIDSIVSAAVTLATRAVIAERSKRTKQ